MLKSISIETHFHSSSAVPLYQWARQTISICSAIEKNDLTTAWSITPYNHVLNAVPIFIHRSSLKFFIKNNSAKTILNMGCVGRYPKHLYRPDILVNTNVLDTE